MNSITSYDSIQMMQGKAKYDLINEIIESASNYLSGSQLMKLNKTLNELFEGYEIFVETHLESDENYEENNNAVLASFISVKKIEGASPRTLEYYRTTLIKFLEWIHVPLADVTTETVREYFSFYQNNGGCSNTTLDNIRRVLSTFFVFCTDERYIQINPMRRIKKIKSAKKVKKAFTDLEIEAMRDYLSKLPDKTKYQKAVKIRDRALFELLLSSGIRIQECVNLNKEDIDLDNSSFKVLGKGNKERICYFNSKAKYYLQQLLSSKIPKKYAYRENPALFINYHSGGRLGINGIERRIRFMGRECNVDAHPHKFRRTFATNLIRREVPIEQVKELMGHANLDTTMIYTVVDQEQIKMNHNRFTG